MHDVLRGWFASVLPSVLLLATGVHAQCDYSWSPLGSGGLTVQALAQSATGDVFAGGIFTTIGGVAANNIARWDGGSWSPLGAGVDSGVLAACVLPNGDVIAGGAFTTAGGAAANRIARWNGSSWSPLGSGITDPSGAVYALAALANGDVVAGGRFTTAGGVAVSNIARWDGSSWSPLGSGTDREVHHLLVSANGELIAGGAFDLPARHVARWNGATWSPFGAGLPSASVGYPHLPHVSLAATPNGDIVAGVNDFNTTGGAVHRWDGTSWSQLAATTGAVDAIVPFPNGDIAAVGVFPSIGGVSASCIARWNGASWSAVGTGLSALWWGMTALASATGELIVGGPFQSAGGVAANGLVRLGTTCPAAVADFGVGCGGQTLTAATLPWVDATLRCQATGLPPVAVVVVATSFAAIPQGVLPLAAVLAEGVPGCDLLVGPDILQVVLSTTGTAESAFFLPSSPPVVGVPFFQQMVSLEIDGLGNWGPIRSTNALQLTAGDF